MNKKILWITAFALVIGTGGFLYGDNQDENKGNQTICPVMDNPVNPDVYVDHQGQRIFFCCQGCVDTFKKEPDKYLKKMKEKGITPMKLKKQQNCPVSGKAIDSDSYVDINGKRVFVCCDGCKAKVKSEPEKYFKKVAEMGEFLEDLKE